MAKSGFWSATVGQAPVAAVSQGEGRWSCSLAPRHATVLRLVFRTQPRSNALFAPFAPVDFSLHLSGHAARLLRRFILRHRLLERRHLFEQFLELDTGQALDHRGKLADDLRHVARDLAGPAA